jgi:hypothetical protein
MVFAGRVDAQGQQALLAASGNEAGLGKTELLAPGGGGHGLGRGHNGRLLYMGVAMVHRITYTACTFRVYVMLRDTGLIRDERVVSP